MLIHSSIFCLPLFSILFSCILAANNISYISNDIYLLDCGTSSPQTKDLLDRNWTKDEKFLFLSSGESSSTGGEVGADDSGGVPYTTVRTFYSKATYTIPVSPGRIFIRFYFYTGYNHKYDIREVNFSVTINDNKLVDNFNGQQMLIQSFDLEHLVREYSAYVENPPLKLTFTPSSNLDTTIAVVNGIEIVSMPNTLYQVPNSPVNLTTLETMFRVNVGGTYIPPSRDTGLYRTWYEDDLWCVGNKGAISSKDKTVTIASPKGKISTYLTPVDVYSTLREMTPNDNVNLRFNLTWRFSVDNEFTYMIRMHFCEIFEMIDKNQVVFDIYINNQTVKTGVDIMELAGGVGIPYILDFMVYQSESEFIWVALHPNVTTKPTYSNALLNGLEIFKVINPEGMLPRINPNSSSVKSNRTLIVGLILGIVGVVALLMAVSVFLLCHFHNHGEGEGEGSSANANTTTSCTRDVCRHFSLEEIKTATRDFDKSLVIGVGGFGKVYKAEIDNGTVVAIKRGNSSSSGQGIHEFQNEIEMLSKLRHRHLVSLLGYCEENGEMILLYDYMACGTLREHLNTTTNPLPWLQRLQICIGAARGLHYLHTGAMHTIIHRDVKSTNILLDEQLVAKVSDFGLSKKVPSLDDTHVSTGVKGTFGYLDPEYHKMQQLTEKSDVYSFGVVLLEVLCGRPVLVRSLPTEQISLVLWAIECHTKGMLEQIMDSSLKGEISPECFKTFVDTAMKCVADTSIQRPTMGDVLWKLEYARVLQVNKDRSLRSMMEIGSRNIFSSEVSDEVTTRAAFSKIIREAKGKGKLN